MQRPDKLTWLGPSRNFLKHWAAVKPGIVVLFAVCALAGCSRAQRTEQRAVALPPGRPDSTLSTASQIGQALIGGGFFTAVRQRFPELTDQQFQGVFLSWNQGQNGRQDAVFLLTGVRYHRELGQAKAIADFCEAQVQGAVSNYFESHPPQ